MTAVIRIWGVLAFVLVAVLLTMVVPAHYTEKVQTGHAIRGAINSATIDTVSIQNAIEKGEPEIISEKGAGISFQPGLTTRPLTHGEMETLPPLFLIPHPIQMMEIELDVDSILRGDSFSFFSYRENKSYTIQLEEMGTLNSESYRVFTGRVFDSQHSPADDSSGYALLLVYFSGGETRVVGSIHPLGEKGNTFFRIFPGDGEKRNGKVKSVISEVQYDLFPEDEIGKMDEENSVETYRGLKKSNNNKNNPYAAGENSSENGIQLQALTTVDALIAYTPQAAFQAGGESNLNALIQLGIEETNLGLANSGARTRIRPVHIQLIPYKETGNFSTELSRLRGSTDGHMDALHSMRSQVGADLVMVLVSSSSMCGMAYVMSPSQYTPQSPGNNAAASQSSFSVLSASCVTGTAMMAHELGHNFGLQHDRPNASGGTPVFNYAYGFKDSVRSFRTIMSYNCTPSCPKILQFSTPLLSYNGGPTGIAPPAPNSADNVQTLNIVSPFVSSHRPTILSALSPAAPSNVQASNGTFSNKIVISWSPSAHATRYSIFRKPQYASGNPCDGTLIAQNIPAFSFTDLSVLTPNQPYYYCVLAVGPNGSSMSQPVLGRIAYLNLFQTVPTNVRASDGTSSSAITITWNAVPGAAGYDIYYSLTPIPSNAFLVGSVSSGTIISFVDPGMNETFILPRITYYYFVRAKNATSVSNFSIGDTGYMNGVQTTFPSPPSSVAASDASFVEKVRVSWSASPGAARYLIYRNRVNNSSTAELMDFRNASPFDDALVFSGTIYYYWIRAFNTNGLSPLSTAYDYGSVALSSTIPAPPANVQATDGPPYSSFILVTWNHSPGSTGYKVFRNTSNNPTTATLLTPVPLTQFYFVNSSGTIPGTTYWYFVKAVNGIGESSFSAGDSGYR